MAKIEKLTPEQEAYLPAFRDEWLSVGLSTARVDRDRSTSAVKALYAAAGGAEPIVMHFDSPAQCIMAINFFRHFKIGADGEANLGANLWDNLGANLWANLGANLRDNLRDNLWANLGANLRDNLGANLGASLRANLRDNLRANLRDNLRDNLWDNLGGNLGANLGDNLGDNLRDNLWANLRANLRDNLWDNLWANLGDNLWVNLRANLRDNLRDNLGANLGDNLGAFVDTWFWGGQDAPWLAFYEFGRKIGVKYDREAHFDAYLEYARSSGWMYAYKGVAFVSDRPTTIRKDEETRLHSENGPSIAFSDGYEIYMWHGTEVPARWINERDCLDPVEVLKTENVEQRAAGMQIVGWPKALDHLEAIVIDSDPDPDHGDLLEVTLPGLADTGLFLRAYCKRNGLIVEGVPKVSDIDNRPIRTVRAAQAWSFGKAEAEFAYPDHVS